MIRTCYIVNGATRNGWDGYIYDVVAERNARRGIATVRVVTEPGRLPDIAAFRAMTAGQPPGGHYVFTLNRMVDTYHIQAGRPRLMAEVGCPVVSYVIDNIGYYLPLFTSRPIAGETRLLADARGNEIVSKLAPGLPACGFFPMWGMPRGKDAPPGPDERDIDLLFVGNAIPVADAEAEAARVARGHADVRDFVHGAADLMAKVRGSEDPATVTLFLLVQNGFFQRHSIDLGWFSEIFRAVDRLARARHRLRTLNGFSRTKITIAGGGMEAAVAGRPNVTLLGPVPLDDVQGLCRRARMVVGDLAGFTEGVELRPSLAMANGAVYFGETNRYLAETIPADCRVEAGDDPDDAAMAALASPAGLAARRERAFAVYDRLVAESDLGIPDTPG